VVGARRPGWLPPLLPVFSARRPLQVAIVGAEATTWAGRLNLALATLIAQAGGQSTLKVVSWAAGLAVGPPGFDRMTDRPTATVIAAECDRRSVGAAASLGAGLGPGELFLALHGDLPALDRDLGVDDRLWNQAQLVRFPILGPREIALLHGPRPPILRRGGFARAALALAQALVDRYQESDP
jgi:hypothetical protein